MNKPPFARHVAIVMVLLLGVWWALASVDSKSEATYPNYQFLVTAKELKQRLQSEPLVVIDVRDDEYFDGKLIPGAIRLPWVSFQRDDVATNRGELFVGLAEAQEILGHHGLFRNDMIVLYDSVARDGGATASYFFWVLDLLGHKKMAILEQGIDGWLAAGYKVVNQPQKRESLMYQAPSGEINNRRWVDENFIYSRLGDPYYQILDVRSPEEYLGEALNTGLNGRSLKAGHIPGAFNINYENNWIDSDSKDIKSYAQLAEMYRGLSPEKGVITYCHSARRGSFGYFILRLMGFEDVMLYDNSWFGWGQPEHYYPVETELHLLTGQSLPPVTKAVAGKAAPDVKSKPATTQMPAMKEEPGQNKPYISCGR